MSEEGGGGGKKKTEMSQFQFGTFENRGGGSLFFKNVSIRNSPQTPSKIRRINLLFWYFLKERCLFLCLPEDIYFHFDLFEWNLAFSDANRPFRMPVRGVSRHQNSLNFKNVSNRSEGGGGSAFFKNVSNSKMSQMSEGGGVNPNWDIFPNFTVFF